MRNASEEVRDRYGRRLVVDGVSVDQGKGELSADVARQQVEEAGVRASRAEQEAKALKEENERLKAELEQAKDALVSASGEEDMKVRR